MISFFGDLDIKGIRFVASRLPNWLLPDPKKMGPMILHTNDDLQIRIDPSIDNGVELCLYQTGTYEKGVLDFISNHYTGKGAFVDIGANIGLMTIYVGKKFPKAICHAFEAHPKTVELLKENVGLNHISNIEIHAFGLGDTTTTLKIHDNLSINRGGASFVINQDGDEGYDVPVKKLDDIVDWKIEMIKLDVEGFEMPVLKGAIESIEKNRPTLIIEVSENRTNAYDSSSEIYQFVKARGYRVYKLKGGKERKSKLIEILKETDLPQHDNIFCIPSE